MTIKLKAALKMSALTPEGKVVKGRNIVDLMKDSALFKEKELPMSYSSMSTALDRLQNSINEAAKGLPGSLSYMREQERIVISIFSLMRSYVEMIANDTTNPRNVIEAAGMSVIEYSGGTPITELTLAAPGNGVVQVTVPRAKGTVAFVYQYSSDGVNWHGLDISKLATIQLKGQTPGVTLSFRYASVEKTQSAFCQPKSIKVV